MMAEKIMSNQENRITVRSLGFSKEEAQEIIASGGMLQAGIQKRLTSENFANAENYTDGRAPGERKLSAAPENGVVEEEAAPSAPGVSEGVVREENQIIKIFPILKIKTITSEDCMSFLRKQNANVIVGGQNMMQMFDPKYGYNELPVGKCTLLFREDDALLCLSDGAYVYRYSDGDIGFYLGFFSEFDWHGYLCLLCFCDLDWLRH